MNSSGTGKFFVQKSKNFEHYKGRNRKIKKIKKSKKINIMILKNEERDESLVLFFAGRKNFNVIFFLNFEQIACTYFL